MERATKVATNKGSALAAMAILVTLGTVAVCLTAGAILALSGAGQ